MYVYIFFSSSNLNTWNVNIVNAMYKLHSCNLCVDLYYFADFDAITDPIMKAKMVALKGINKVMVQNSMGMTPMVMNR